MIEETLFIESIFISLRTVTLEHLVIVMCSYRFQY